jgi:hypothetical protein
VSKWARVTRFVTERGKYSLVSPSRRDDQCLMSPMWRWGNECGYDETGRAVQMVDSMTYFIFQRASTEVTKWQLESTSAALKVHL